MYKVEIPAPTNLYELLELYSQEDIFTIVFKEYPKLDEPYLSPFRPDNHPNCFFHWYKGKLYFKDYAEPYPRDCFHAVKDYLHKDSYSGISEFIIDYFENHPVLIDQHPPVFNREKETKDCGITIKIRPFEERDRLYWSQYDISEQQLTEDHVTPVSAFRFYSTCDKNWKIVRPFDVAYAISGFDHKHKIYRPTNRNKHQKWMTNCGPNDIGNILNIDLKGELLIITKSYKDHRVIRNQGYKNVIWFQSESMFPNMSTLESLAKDFKRVVIFFDNDCAGITGSKNLYSRLERFNSDLHLIQSPYFYMKDPAEIVSIRGNQELKSLLWEKCQM